MVTLRGPGVAQGARAQVMILNNERAVLMTEELPPVPKDKTLQIWVIEDNVAKPSGLFEPKEESIVVAVGTPLDGAETIAVSVEPDGGSTDPTTEPLLTAKLYPRSSPRAFIYPHCRVYSRAPWEAPIKEVKEDL